MSASILEQNRCSLAAEVLLREGTLTLKAFGTSMLPTLWPGDVATIQACGFADAAVGDIVLCRRAGRFYLHRLIAKTSMSGERSLTTRGDSMPAADPPTSPEDILGKVSAIRRGLQVILPSRRLSLPAKLAGRLMARSNLTLQLALRFHGQVQTSSDLPASSAAV